MNKCSMDNFLELGPNKVKPEIIMLFDIKESKKSDKGSKAQRHKVKSLKPVTRTGNQQLMI